MRTLLAALILTSGVCLAADAPKPVKAAPAPASPKVPRLRKQPITGCGVSIYAPDGFKVEDAEKSPDGSDVITAEAEVGAHTFGVICVRFKDEMSAEDDLEAVLTGYLDYLKESLEITQSAGYGKGHRIDAVPAARGMIDFWEDEDGDEWKVKGWVTPKHLVFLSVYGEGEYPLPNVREMFLDGFRED